MSTKVSLYYYATKSLDVDGFPRGHIHIYYEMYQGSHYIEARHPETGRVVGPAWMPGLAARLFSRLCERLLGLPT